MCRIPPPGGGWGKERGGLLHPILSELPALSAEVENDKLLSISVGILV